MNGMSRSPVVTPDLCRSRVCMSCTLYDHVARARSWRSLLAPVYVCAEWTCVIGPLKRGLDTASAIASMDRMALEYGMYMMWFGRRTDASHGSSA